MKRARETSIAIATPSTYPLTRKYDENNPLRVIFVVLRDFAPSESLEKNDFFKELREKFLIFTKVILKHVFA